MLGARGLTVRESNGLKEGADWLPPQEAESRVSARDDLTNLDLAQPVPSREDKLPQPQKPRAESANSPCLQFCSNAATGLNRFSGDKTTQGMDNTFPGPVFHKCFSSAVLSHIKMNYCL